MMVPFLQEIVRQGVGLGTSGRSGVAGQGVILPGGTVELTPLLPSGSPGESVADAPIPVEGLRGPVMPLRRAGVWSARSSTGASLGIVSVRADVGASRVDLRSESEIARWLSTLGVSCEWIDETGLSSAAAAESSEGAGDTILSAGPEKPPISFPLLLAAIAVALAEVVMARLFSHARVDETPSATGSATATETTAGSTP